MGVQIHNLSLSFLIMLIISAANLQLLAESKTFWADIEALKKFKTEDSHAQIADYFDLVTGTDLSVAPSVHQLLTVARLCYRIKAFPIQDPLFLSPMAPKKLVENLPAAVVEDSDNETVGEEEEEEDEEKPFAAVTKSNPQLGSASEDDSRSRSETESNNQLTSSFNLNIIARIPN
ncbi:hypothetical protein ACFX2I_027739 [Malus domestica]